MRLNVKTDQVRTQQTVEQFALPGANTKGFGVWPRNVPENRDSCIRPLLLDQPWQEREVVVLKQYHRVRNILNLVQHGLGELVVHGLVVFPVGSTKDGPRVCNVTERPETLIRKSVVIAFFLILGEPHPAEGIVRIIRRYAQTVVLVNCLCIGVPATMCDPSAVTSAKHRFQSSDQAARRDHYLP